MAKLPRYLKVQKNCAKLVRTAKYTFTVYDDGNITLYNNITAPYQQTNLSLSSLPEEDLQMLSREIGYWLKLSQDLWVKERKNSQVIDNIVSKK